jgi:diaminopimelate epimerase
MKRTSYHRIWRARQRDVPRLEVYRALRRLTRACATGDAAAALNAIRLAVSDYVPSEAVTALCKAGEAGRAGEAGKSRREAKAGG